MNYQNYATEDFLLDKKFREWVEKPDKESDVFWSEFLARHPEKTEAINKAKEILQKMQFREYTLAPDEVSGLWSNILKEKNTTTPGEDEEKGFPLYRELQFETKKHQKKRAVKFPFISMAAGISAFLIITGLYWWLRAHNEHIYTTAYGQTTEVRLADGSIATLNANSTLRVPKRWQDDAREVWLEGEAFFQVKPSQNSNDHQLPEKFVVHTQGAAVEVLGTQFNVNTRREKVQVVLNSGKVKLKWQEREFMMKPGELVEVSQTNHEVSQKQVNPEAYSSWKDNHLLCDATPLSEVASIAEDRFGYEMIFQDNSLRDIKVSGTIPLDSLEIFNLVLSRLIEANFQQKDHQVIISK